ncbi:MAG: hypothetical protein ACLFR6_02465 [Salinarchaeum sp.]
MSVTPIVILLVIGGLVAVTVGLAVRYWRSIKRVAAELGWGYAVAVAVGNLVLVVGLFVLTTGAGAIGVRTTGWVGAFLGLPEPLRLILVTVAALIGIAGVTLSVALAYNRLFPRVVQAFS